MSTRSCIARSDDLGFSGRYHHSDGYPTGLGAFLHGAYRAQFNGDLALMQKILLDDHPAGWSSILGTNLLHPNPGFVEFWSSGDPESARPHIKNPVTGEYENNPAYDHSRPLCYCHGDRAEEENLITCRCGIGQYQPCDALFIEYAYVLTELGLEVWYSVAAPGEDAEPYPGGHVPPAYKHERYGMVPWIVPDDWAGWLAVQSEIRCAKDAAHAADALARKQAS